MRLHAVNGSGLVTDRAVGVLALWLYLALIGSM